MIETRQCSCCRGATSVTDVREALARRWVSVAGAILHSSDSSEAAVAHRNSTRFDAHPTQHVVIDPRCAVELCFACSRRPASLTSLEKRVGFQEMSSVMSPDNSTVAVGVVDVAVVSVSDGISGVTADVRCWLGLAWTSTS